MSQFINTDSGAIILSKLNVIDNAVTASTNELNGKFHNIYTIGDSLTYFKERNGGLNALLGDLWILHNCGIASNSTTQMRARFTAAIITSGDADYVIIWGGINDINNGDSAATIEANLQSMYSEAHNSGAVVVAINITPWNGLAAGKQTILDNVNTWIANTAINIDYKIDAYTLLEDPDSADHLLAGYNSGDGLHLSATGYNVVDEAIVAAVPVFLTASLVKKPIREMTDNIIFYPIVTAQAGAITAYSASAYYTRLGNVINYHFAIIITDAGTASAGIFITLPVAAALAQGEPVFGFEKQVTLKALTGNIMNSTQARIYFYDGTFPGATNNHLNGQVIYYAA
jgi:lysophospholipase L1-like esterase